jgi:hypothetical protein
VGVEFDFTDPTDPVHAAYMDWIVQVDDVFTFSIALEGVIDSPGGRELRDSGALVARGLPWLQLLLDHFVETGVLESARSQIPIPESATEPGADFVLEMMRSGFAKTFYRYAGADGS